MEEEPIVLTRWIDPTIEQLQRENKNLKQALSDTEETANEIRYELEKENQELKKQLKPNYYVKGLEGTLKEYQQEMNKVTTQQNEFILYLRHLSNWYSADGAKQGMVNEILQKYKEIIGYKDE